MKKIFSFAIVAALLATSCKKSADLEYPLTPGTGVSEVPANFSQKLLLEEFTGAWCGYCPAGAAEADSIAADYPGKLFPVAIHVGDVMSCEDAADANGNNLIDALFNDYGYPGGTVMRQTIQGSDLAPNQWKGKVISRLSTQPKCGMALDARTVNGNTLDLAVHVGFAQAMAGAYSLHVYVVQDYVQDSSSLYDQNNYFSATGSDPDSSSPFFNLPPTINFFKHKHVLVKVATPVPAGYALPQAAMQAGKTHVVNYSIDLTGLPQSKLEVIAFVDKYTPSALGHRIENVQAVRIGGLQDWD